ncbi:hypothetical protein [Candidatus Binatus sp.]|uniref:hypothetical protein n=1 Tax=Candidatus Binatus sp. TaxID=2811406 RepID=UPI003C742DCE
MTTSQMEFLSEILDGEEIPDGAFTYFRGRLLNRIHSLLLRAYQKRSSEEGLKQKDLARLIHRSSEVVNRHLAISTNSTLITIADFLLGLRAELDVNLIFLEDLAHVNSQANEELVAHNVVAEHKLDTPPQSKRDSNALAEMVAGRENKQRPTPTVAPIPPAQAAPN